MMKKLTAERCKKQIEEWQRMMSVSDVAVMVELNLQAYVIALPVLEQQEKLADGWIEWHGGECPVDGCVKVEYRLRDGDTSNEPASCLAWEHEGECYDIIAYRIIDRQQKGDDGWIEWDGNSQPVNSSVIVKVRWTDGSISCGPCRQFFWGRNCGNPIIAYRVVEQERERGEEE